MLQVTITEGSQEGLLMIVGSEQAVNAVCKHLKYEKRVHRAGKKWSLSCGLTLSG